MVIIGVTIMTYSRVVLYIMLLTSLTVYSFSTNKGLKFNKLHPFLCTIKVNILEVDTMAHPRTFFIISLFFLC